MNESSLQTVAERSVAEGAGPALQSDPSRRWLRPAVFFGLAGMLLGGLSRLTILDLDLFHELAFVREAVRTGHFPFQDTFAYTPTVYPVVHHEWGTGVVLYAITIAGGLGAPGLMLVKYILSAFLAVGCFVCARRRGASEAVAAFVAPLVVPMALCGFSTVRAQLFTLCFLVMFYLLISRRGAGSRWVPWWLVVCLVWLNMHGGFLVGFGLFAVYTAERLLRAWLERRSLSAALRDVRTLIACGLVMALLPLTSPFGADYVAYLWRAVRMPRPIIGEWQPLWSAQYGEVLLCFTASLVLVCYAAATRGLRELRGVSLIVAPAFLALQHTRHLPIYAVTWMCLAPAWLAPTAFGTAVERLWRERASVLLAVWVIFGAFGAFYATHNAFWRLRIPTSPVEASEGVPVYPAGAVDYLAAHSFQGNVMVPFDAGSYVSWKLHPAVRVSLDSRYEVAYPPQAAEEAVRFYAADEGWRDTLSRYPTDAVLVPWWSPLNRSLEAGEGDVGGTTWRRVYRDDAYALYVRGDLAGRYPTLDRRNERIVATFP